ncbi:T-lymphocyte activation antigen CD86-like isoform X2 [Xiphias gladius]|uniref:T-lymphocyte activation antigen CD86-like isoform X2 n=1 Tax=Xiphias gladius TaxID=8245 RepID=UPI001A98AD7E|nr:T-lymphocyte activation antigen CD86-like isoform X2 [Xiphias gladius]
MASICNLQYFLLPRNQRLYFWLVPLVWTVTWTFSVTESTSPIHLRGEVGGNVTFHCPRIPRKTVIFFYFQIGDKFVNGYYASKNVTEIWENTRVDHTEMTVHMYRLNISHSGEYKCIIRYSDNEEITQQAMHLSVTANYTKPTVTMNCDENLGFGCLLTCASHGGYPGTKMMWNVPVSRNSSSQMWKVVNSSEVPNPSTMLFNSSSTAYFNCSNEELKYLSCSVGDVTSDMFSVCTPMVPPVTYSPVMIVATCAVVVVILMVVALLSCKCKKRQTGAAAGDVTQEWRVNGCEEELIVLNETKGGKEAS